MDTIEIEKVVVSDVQRLQQIAKQTFQEAFSANNTPENLEKYMEESFSLDKLTSELNDNSSNFYFATCNNDVVGYLKLNFGQSQTDLKDYRALEIERIYVLKEFYGKKAGQLLFKKAVEIAKQANLEYVWLGVWEKNERAINFYKKNGFVEFDVHSFQLGNEEQTDILMKIQLFIPQSG
jgi:ribosomal protein S18 acetylase RimI-like enzyme